MAPRTRSRVIRPPHIRPGDDDDRTCPVCDRWFQMSQGLMSHLSLARSCKWYRKGKNPIRLDEDIPEPVEMDELVVGNDNPLNGIEVDDEDFEDVIQNRDLFRFVLPDQPPDGFSSPGASSSYPRQVTISPPILDDDDDTRTFEEDVTAGAVIAMQPTIVEKWKAYFEDAKDDDRMDVDGGENDRAAGEDPDGKWRPFASELDWRVASWILKEDVGQNALNRFLSIPGVSLNSVPVRQYLIIFPVGRGESRAELQRRQGALRQSRHHPRQSPLENDVYRISRSSRGEASCTIPRYHRGHQGLAREPVLCEANRMATSEGVHRRIQNQARLFRNVDRLVVERITGTLSCIGGV